MEIADLSLVHRTTGCIGSPDLASDFDFTQFRLTPEQVEFYQVNGYVTTSAPVVSEEQLVRLEQEVEILVNMEKTHPLHHLFYEFHSNESGDANAVVSHFLGHWRITPGFHDLCFLSAITVPASQLMGEVAVRLWHDQFFYKPAKCGGPVQWHQDYSYWTRSVPMNHMTVHVAIDDQTAENGGLMYIPGSHRWSRNGKPLPKAAQECRKEKMNENLDEKSFTADMNALSTVLNDEERLWWKDHPAVLADLKRGHASFHHPLAVHGSYGNHSDKSRRAAVVNYFADGTVAACQGELLKNTTMFKEGEKIAGQFYPLVYQPAQR